MELIYQDNDIVVCVKPFGVRSTDEPGGVPDLVREALGDARADVRTVHRLDQVVGGLMVLARNKASASELSRQVREDGFGKEYLAVVHGHPEQDAGTLRDLLFRDDPALSNRRGNRGSEPGSHSAGHRQNAPDPSPVFRQKPAPGGG